jgi:hypothetical protein
MEIILRRSAIPSLLLFLLKKSTYPVFANFRMRRKREVGTNTMNVNPQSKLFCSFMPKPETGKADDKQTTSRGLYEEGGASTKAIGEEGGQDSKYSTMAVGEEGGRDDFKATTAAVGEEGGQDSKYSTMAVGEEGGSGHQTTTLAVGEEGGSDDFKATTAAVGEEGGQDPKATTMAVGEEGGADRWNDHDKPGFLPWPLSTGPDYEEKSPILKNPPKPSQPSVVPNRVVQEDSGLDIHKFPKGSAELLKPPGNGIIEKGAELRQELKLHIPPSDGNDTSILKGQKIIICPKEENSGSTSSVNSQVEKLIKRSFGVTE